MQLRLTAQRLDLDLQSIAGCPYHRQSHFSRKFSRCWRKLLKNFCFRGLIVADRRAQAFKIGTAFIVHLDRKLKQ
ncbi:hypothetical protein NDA01_30200 [Trichocoleus desertorum AS-A10]